MKQVEAKQIIPVSVELNDDEIYRIVLEELLRLYNFPTSHDRWYEIRNGDLCQVWMENYGPYDPDERSDVIRTAGEDDIHGVDALEKLANDYKGWKHAKRY